MASIWIWQHPNWTQFTWREADIQPRLRGLWLKIGTLTATADLVADDTVELETLLTNLVASSAIEDEKLNVQSLRSSLARRLGLNAALSSPSKRSDGLAELMLDAINNCHQPLTLERLCQWHRWLFPHDSGLLYRVQAGMLRGSEPMQVVSGRLDKPLVHFEAPPRAQLDNELSQFLHWFNESATTSSLDPLLRAALVHFHFVTLHPFDDGNGRIARALTDMALAQADPKSIRLYAMSVAILEHRQDYYRILEQSQRSGSDVTAWLLWYLDTFEETLNNSLNQIERSVARARFWANHRDTELSPGQITVLNRLLEGGANGFEGGISAGQYQKVAKVSKATATRHLADLQEKGCLEKMPGGGRSTRYTINAV